MILVDCNLADRSAWLYVERSAPRLKDGPKVGLGLFLDAQRPPVRFGEADPICFILTILSFDKDRTLSSLS